MSEPWDPAILGDEMVRIFVGEDLGEDFTVHRKFLCSRWEYFVGVIADADQYAHAGKPTFLGLPEETSETFEALMDYHYNGELPYFELYNLTILTSHQRQERRKEFETHSSLMRSLFYLADRLEDKVLMGKIMDQIQEEYAAPGRVFFCDKVIREIHANSKKTNLLYQYALYNMLKELKGRDENSIKACNLLMEELPGLRADVMKFRCL
ncbi:hypothetical protein SBOR_9990 [Sclerotinia borealis F-4128]|uniref:BTB domain-containing protein n=1 Tax=Sclerotinia borealis (strain F-4128) TaxID=1432307 RepID=W9C1L5_SCLBF|nr:hypothetical protein SBOR_9990 [Sclerotinia borealis F-4128]